MQDGVFRAVRKGRRPGQGLVQDAAEGIDVGARADRSSLDLLGSRVLDGAEKVAGRGQAARSRLLRDAEVREVRVVGALLDEDVARLHVSMDERVCVRGVERAGELLDQEDRPADAERAALEDLLQIGALNEAHGDVEEPVGLPGVVDGDDVRVVDRGRDVRLAHEALAELLVPGQLVRQHLERDLAGEPYLLRDVDDAHAAAAEDRFDPEPGDFRPDPRRSAQLMRARRHGSSESRRTVGWKVRQAVHQYRTQ